MDVRLQVFLIICIVLFLTVIFVLLKRKKLNLRYTLLWLFTGLFMLVVTIFPHLIDWAMRLIGVVTPTSFVFFMEGLFVLVLLLSLTSIVSRLSNKIYRLTQTQALLEKRIRDLENRLEHHIEK